MESCGTGITNVRPTRTSDLNCALDFHETNNIDAGIVYLACTQLKHAHALKIWTKAPLQREPCTKLDSINHTSIFYQTNKQCLNCTASRFCKASCSILVCLELPRYHSSCLHTLTLVASLCRVRLVLILTYSAKAPYMKFDEAQAVKSVQTSAKPI